MGHRSRSASREALATLLESFCRGRRTNSPNCFLDAPKALVRLGDKKLEGLYFHFPTMNLVLVTSDDRIGVQMMWLIRGGWRVLVERLVEGKVSN